MLTYHTLSDNTLLEYGERLGIPRDILTRECKQVEYYADGAQNAILFLNDSGGGEVMLADGSKRSIAPKGISVRKGDASRHCVFDGFIDYLSYLAMCKDGDILPTCVILNSWTNWPAGVAYLRGKSDIRLCLNRTAADTTATRKIIRAIPTARDVSGRFAPCRSLNTYLVARLTAERSDEDAELAEKLPKTYQTLALVGAIVEASPETTYPTANGGRGVVRNYVFEYLNGGYRNRFSFSAFGGINDAIMPYVGKEGRLWFNVVGKRKDSGKFINNIVACGFTAGDGNQ